MPEITACMIVKNEEEMLGGCLESIRNVVDKIVIVDTGSTDSTVEIAMEYGADVYHHKWQDDFSLHRNQSFAYAQSLYILYIDADEILMPEAGEQLPGLLRFMSKRNLAYAALQIENDLPGGGSGLHIMPRIFKKGAVYFKGVIQNQPTVRDKGYISNLRIRHFGYNLDPEAMRQKCEDRDALLQKAIAKEPDNILYKQYRIRNLRMRNQWEECKEMADALIAAGPIASREREQMILLDRLVAHMALGHPASLSLAKDLAHRYPDNLDAQFYLSTTCMEKGDLDGVIAALRRYDAIHHKIETIGLQEFISLSTWGQKLTAYNNLGVAYLQKGDLMNSLGALFLATGTNGNTSNASENLRKAIGALLFEKGELMKHFPELEEDGGVKGA